MALRPTRPQDRPQSRSEQLAERKSAQDDVFLREVDDALRQDEMMGAFKRYGRPLGAAVVLGLAAFAGYLWWNNSQQEAVGAQGEQLTVALERVTAGRPDLADKQLEPITKDAGPGTRSAALLARAGIALQQGKTDAAVKLYAQVSADADAPQPMRDLATVREVAARYDALPPQQVIDRLKPLAVPGNPWFGSAGELTAMAWLKLGKPEMAGPLFAAISRDKEVPQSLRSRTQQMAGLLGVDAIDDADKAASGAPQ